MADSMDPPVLKVCHLSRIRNGVKIFDRLSFSLQVGQMTLLIGPSGGGKSSLLRLLNRLDEADEGEILLQGENILDLQPAQLRRRVALVMQKAIMFPGTVLDNLQSPFRLRQAPVPAEDSALVRRVIDLCGLESALLRRDAGDLSQGQQQRVSLARTLMSEPRVLLLDEPTSALDRPSSDRLGELLQRLCLERQLGVLMVAHDLRLVERVADQILFLSDGRFAEVGSVDILQRPRSPQLREFLNNPQQKRYSQEVPA
jgi:putative ABC transport system ATP-binding protein